MKLIAFLSRRLPPQTTQAELHRWIRTGQVRVNGSRTRPFDRLAEGDSIRLPPFANPITVSDAIRAPSALDPGKNIGCGITIHTQRNDFIALEKPAGIPSQPGTKHTTCLVSCLASFFAGSAYVPAPVHRLDKETSGLILAGLTHRAQQRLHELFTQSEGKLCKQYLAWVNGHWPYQEELLLEDTLRKSFTLAGGGKSLETVRVVPNPATCTCEKNKTATSVVSLLKCHKTPLGVVSLLRITLLTGRTHQIRVQLASRGFSVIGDRKYGGVPWEQMLLHAYKLDFPWDGSTMTLISTPSWGQPFAVDQAALA